MQSWGRWLSRGLVVGGLVWLVVVAYRYGSFVSVFGDTPCERDPARCDDRANLLAQRELGRWYLAGFALLVTGLVATAVRRAARPAPGRGQDLGHGQSQEVTAAGVPSGSASAATARVFGWGVVSFAPVLLTIIFWLFGGTALYLAVAIAWCLLLAFLLDRAHRRHRQDGGDLGSLLLAGAGAVVGVVTGCLAGLAVGHALRPGSGSAAFVLVPLGMALGTGAGAAAVTATARLLARRWHGWTPAPAAPAAVASSVAVAAFALVVATPAGRDLATGIRSDLYPELTAATAAPVEPVLPDPRPDLSFTQPPAPTQTPTPTVVAGRACTDADLTLAARGWDSAMGSTAVSVVATNTSDTACWVKGYPVVRLAQGGTDLDLAVTRSATQRWGNGDVVPDRRVGLAAGGGRASFDLWWRGYRSAADQQTPQSLTVTLPGSAPLELGLSAPYLLDVVQDAEVTVMRWKLPSPGSG